MRELSERENIVRVLCADDTFVRVALDMFFYIIKGSDLFHKELLSLCLRNLFHTNSKSKVHLFFLQELTETTFILCNKKQIFLQ